MEYSEKVKKVGIFINLFYISIWFLTISDNLRVREKITLQFIALRFRLDLVDLIELDRKRSLSYTEDSVSEDRTKMA